VYSSAVETDQSKEVARNLYNELPENQETIEFIYEKVATLIAIEDEIKRVHQSLFSEVALAIDPEIESLSVEDSEISQIISRSISYISDKTSAPVSARSKDLSQYEHLAEVTNLFKTHREELLGRGVKTIFSIKTSPQSFIDVEENTVEDIRLESLLKHVGNPYEDEGRELKSLHLSLKSLFG